LVVWQWQIPQLIADIQGLVDAERQRCGKLMQSVIDAGDDGGHRAIYALEEIQAGDVPMSVR
jgi:hypothetical protein